MPKNEPDVTVSYEKPSRRSAAVGWLSWAKRGLLAVLGLACGAAAWRLGAPGILVAFALLAGGLLALRQWLPWRVRRKSMAIAALVVLVLVGAGVGGRTL